MMEIDDREKYKFLLETIKKDDIIAGYEYTPLDNTM